MATPLEINFADVVDISPRPISCMRLNEKTKQLALFRGGSYGSIELWDVAHQPCLVNEILDLELIDGKPSVESIVWIKGRLFSAGLHGFVVEHDLSSLKIKNKTAATSGPVWCLAVKQDETQLAVGTEDGFINIFDVLDEGLQYLKVLDRQEGRVLCIDWSPCGFYITSGSVDSIRLWDVEKGHAIQRLITGRSKNKETIVWSIVMLDNLTIVSGDSRGFVSFWDGRVGVLKFKIVTHKADILALKLSQDRTQLYAAGVDPVVIIINRIGSSDKWVKSHPRNMHTNDVMTLETYGNRLFSGGQDADLVMSSFPPKVVTKFPPLPRQSFISQSQGHLLVRMEASVNIWKLPRPNSELKKIVEFKTKSSQQIYSTCLSPNGKLFALSTLKYIRIFQLLESSDQKAPKLTRFQLNDEENCIPNHFWHVNFLSDELLLGISADGRKEIYLDINEKDLTAEINGNEPGPLCDKPAEENHGIENVIASPSGAYVCMNSANHISIQKVSDDENDNIPECIVPHYYARLTSMTFHPDKPLLLLTYADHCIQVYNFSSRRIIFSEKIKKKFDNLQPLLGATWVDNGNAAVLFQVDTMYLLKMVVNEEPVKKQRRQRRGSGNSQEEVVERYDFCIKSSVTNYKYLTKFGSYKLGDSDKLFCVEINPNSILEKLPPAFTKKRFGT